MRIAVTGASGFIGRNLVQSLTQSGICVLACSRRPLPPLIGMEWMPWKLGFALPSRALATCDLLIHLAHDFDGERGALRTKEGTLILARQARDIGMPRQIFVSSYSAGEHASSLYGRTKYALERALRELGAVVVRPGLVLGDNGIFGRMRRCAEHWPVVPLPDGGSGQVPVIEVSFLCRILKAIAGECSPQDEYNLFEERQPTLRQIVLDMVPEGRRAPLIVPIPSALLRAVLFLGAAVHLPMPINRDNLDGFLANQSISRATSVCQFEELRT